MGDVLKLIKEHWVVVALAAAALLFAWTYFKGKEEGETKEVKVTLKHPDGTTENYNPTALVMELEKRLRRWCVTCGDRCETIQKVYELSTLKFIAFVGAYKDLTGVDLEEAIQDVYRHCPDGSLGVSLNKKIVERIKNLNDQL